MQYGTFRMFLTRGYRTGIEPNSTTGKTTDPREKSLGRNKFSHRLVFPALLFGPLFSTPFFITSTFEQLYMYNYDYNYNRDSCCAVVRLCGCAVVVRPQQTERWRITLSRRINTKSSIKLESALCGDANPRRLQRRSCCG